MYECETLRNCRSSEDQKVDDEGDNANEEDGDAKVHSSWQFFFILSLALKFFLYYYCLQWASCGTGIGEPDERENVLQTKVDAQCDSSCHHLQQSMCHCDEADKLPIVTFPPVFDAAIRDDPIWVSPRSLASQS